MNAAKAFIDTNVLLYGVDGGDPGKKDRARALLASIAENGTGTISPQVAAEFAFNLVKKFGRTPAEADILCDDLVAFAIATATVDTVRDALRLMSKASLSFWDANIVATAAREGCDVLYSEDMPDGQIIAGVDRQSVRHKSALTEAGLEFL